MAGVLEHTFSYDMLQIPGAIDFFDFIHRNDGENVGPSQEILGQVIENVNSFHQRHVRENAGDEIIQRYVQEKCVANARIVLDLARELTGSEDVNLVVNGDEIPWEHLRLLEDSVWLTSQIRSRATSVVHGDLTIENIIVSPGHGAGWYLIDPNPQNVFNSPLLDWAKLFQSLHRGYEFLNHVGLFTVNGHEVRIRTFRSFEYTVLFAFLVRRLEEQLGDDQLVQEVCFHELVHYLRLIPYKIRQSKDKGVLFLATLAVLLERYLNRTAAKKEPTS